MKKLYKFFFSSYQKCKLFQALITWSFLFHFVFFCKILRVLNSPNRIREIISSTRLSKLLRWTPPRKPDICSIVQRKKLPYTVDGKFKWKRSLHSWGKLNSCEVTKGHDSVSQLSLKFFFLVFWWDTRWILERDFPVRTTVRVIVFFAQDTFFEGEGWKVLTSPHSGV